MLNQDKFHFTGKIAIATNDQKRVTGHIGRCKAFIVYQIDGEKIINKEMRENLFTNHRMMHQGHQHPAHTAGMHREGGGRQSHEHLINGLKDCSYLVSSGGGWRVVEDLKQHNISILFTDVEMIEDVVKKFIKGELKNETDLVCDHHDDK